MDSLESTLFGMLFGDYSKAEKIGNTEINGYTIDTCDTIDQGFETAIWYKNNDMVIVERYPNKNTAEQGHKKWVNICTTNKPIAVYSVQTDQIEPLISLEKYPKKW